jgi:hypothetical protein
MTDTFKVVDIPKHAPTNGQWREVLEALKKLEPGKAIQLPLDGKTPQQVRASLGIPVAKAGLRLRTISGPDKTIFCWTDPART